MKTFKQVKVLMFIISTLLSCIVADFSSNGINVIFIFGYFILSLISLKAFEKINNLRAVSISNEDNRSLFIKGELIEFVEEGDLKEERFLDEYGVLENNSKRSILLIVQLLVAVVVFMTIFKTLTLGFAIAFATGFFSVFVLGTGHLKLILMIQQLMVFVLVPFDFGLIILLALLSAFTFLCFIYENKLTSIKVLALSLGAFLVIAVTSMSIVFYDKLDKVDDAIKSRVVKKVKKERIKISYSDADLKKLKSPLGKKKLTGKMLLNQLDKLDSKIANLNFVEETFGGGNQDILYEIEGDTQSILDNLNKVERHKISKGEMKLIASKLQKTMDKIKSISNKSSRGGEAKKNSSSQKIETLEGLISDKVDEIEEDLEQRELFDSSDDVKNKDEVNDKKKSPLDNLWSIILNFFSKIKSKHIIPLAVGLIIVLFIYRIKKKTPQAELYDNNTIEQFIEVSKKLNANKRRWRSYNEEVLSCYKILHLHEDEVRYSVNGLNAPPPKILGKLLSDDFFVLSNVFSKVRYGSKSVSKKEIKLFRKSINNFIRKGKKATMTYSS